MQREKGMRPRSKQLKAAQRLPLSFSEKMHYPPWDISKKVYQSTAAYT